MLQHVSGSLDIFVVGSFDLIDRMKWVPAILWQIEVDTKLNPGFFVFEILQIDF